MFTQRDLDFIFGTGIAGTKKVNRYPLTNIAEDDEGNLIIEVAVAGFSKKEIDIEVKGNELHITGKKEALPSDINYHQKHISTDDFERVLGLHEKFVGGDISATFKNGLLTIRVIPKEPTKKLIKID